MSRIVRRGEVVDSSLTGSEKAINRLAREGIDMPHKPSMENVFVPDDLTSLDDEALMDLFARLNAWHGYLAVKAAGAMVDERLLESDLEVQEAKTLLASWGGTSKDRVAVARAERSIDPQVTSIREAHATAYAYRKMVEALSNNSERDVALVSRELTRRTSNASVQHRAARMTT